MWFLLAVLALGFLQLLDTGMYSYVAYNMVVDGVYLGVLSALWSVTYIVFNKVLGGVADRGHNRLLILMSCVSVATSVVLLKNLNYVNGLVSYSLHAIATVAVSLAVSVTALEVFDYFRWGSVNLAINVLPRLIRGAALMTLALGVVNVLNSVIITASILVPLTILLPRMDLTLERRLYSMSRRLEGIQNYVRASTALLYLHRPREAYEYIERVWSSWDVPSSGKVLLAAFLYVTFSDMVFTVLPLIVKALAGLEDLYLSWGTAFIVSSLATLLIAANLPSGTRLAAVLTAIRGLTMALLLPMFVNTLSIAAYLVIAMIFGTVVDALLYKAYVESTSGYRISTYFISRELGSIVGSLIGGLLITYTPALLPVVVICVAVASATTLLI